MLNVPAIFLQCSIDQMFSMFHRKTFMVNLAKTFNKNMESVPAWNMQCVGIDRIDLNRPNRWNRSNRTQINHQMWFAKRCKITILVKVSARIDHFLPSYLARLDLFSSWKSAFLLDPHAKIWTRFPLVPSLVKPFHHLVQDIPFSDMIRTFEMTMNSNAFRTFS